MPEPLTPEEREKLCKWAQEIWDEGTGQPALMGHALEILRYEALINNLEDGLGIRQYRMDALESERPGRYGGGG